ncbi:MotA/TolQ/ExbB proton channel family protein [Acidihalobacter ferrooxydans]|uniref:Biopolymer transporter ExbB n=1 Tax=Acidihalobacter ferrooxydans TaxID=1765967 RepID=A0A1P8UFM5_9GAMM|nr:MotA/TolQ/ExbB proton channel family protein [Acidihalobacter ferrooxydans]APZ42652.1 biopolymer transporter ExbB [Acidihalobacter ferrooxydans]
MFEIIKAGGWLMLPIILASILALAIVLERFWTLRRSTIIPPGLLDETLRQLKAGELDAKRLQAIEAGSPFGRILATGVRNRNRTHELMKERIEETGRQVMHELDRYLNTLGTIASVSPLLGLLGTVFGMIRVFTVITSVGVGNPHVLAGGIAEALITTAAGLCVAIPALIFHRYFRGLVTQLAVEMEDGAVRMVDGLRGMKNARSTPPASKGAKP